jgi:hypothetical protein
MGWNTHDYVMVPTYPISKAKTTNMKEAWDFMHGPEVTCPASDCGE